MMANEIDVLLSELLQSWQCKIDEPAKDSNPMQALTTQPVQEVIMANSNLTSVHPCVKRGGKTFYIYTHSKPDGTVFYVGKGVGDRAVDFWQRSAHHKRITAKHGAKNICVVAYPVHDEVHAYTIERQLIMSMRKAGLKLCNTDDGGIGRIGVRLTAEHKEKLRQSLLGHAVSLETRAKMSAATKGRTVSEATRAKMLTRTLSESHKAALLAAITGRQVSEEQKERTRQKMKGRKLSPDHIRKMADSKRGVKQSPEHVAKRSIGLRAAWARRKASAAMEVV